MPSFAASRARAKRAWRIRCTSSCIPTAGRPEEAVAIELFGAWPRHKGERPGGGAVGDADEGTLVLDEVIGLSPALQRRLLDLVKRGRYHREYEDRERVAQVNVIVITDGNLMGEVTAGRFRHDLFYRLNVLVIRLAPLREHKADIPLLVEHFLADARRLGLPEFHCSQELMSLLIAFDWPGNVRQLKNCVDRIAAMSSEGAVPSEILPTELRNIDSASTPHAFAAVASGDSCPAFTHTPVSPVISIHESERQAIERALAASHGERNQTARVLGIGRTTLYRKMKQYGIE